jgi:rhomboid protease GluP
MSGAATHPLDVILHQIGQAAPDPWYPRRAHGLDPQILDDVLQVLWLQALIEKAPSGSNEAGVGLVLTPLGKRTLEEPDLLARLREGRPIDTTDPAHVVRSNLANPPRVRMCKLILAANIGVFLWGLSLAWPLGEAKRFLVGFTLGPVGAAILHRTGSLTGSDLVAGQWWRLLTSGFNHLGLIHLGLNMLGIYSVGSFIEQRWGWWRFLIIYFCSVWTGSCLAMARQPNVLTLGASGGLFGVFAALIGWLLLYGKYIPPGFRRRAWQNIMFNIFVLAILSYMLSDMISHWGHIGGAIGGFVSCFILHFQRFGPPTVRVLGVLALPVLAWGSFAYMQHAGPMHRLLLDAERKRFNQDVIASISTTTQEATQVFEQKAKPLLERHPTRRDEAETKQALEALHAKTDDLKALAAKLQQSGPSRDKEVEETRTTALDYVNALIEASEYTARSFRAGKDWKNADEKELQAKWSRARKLAFLNDHARPITSAIARMLKTCENRIDPLMNQLPSRWDLKKVEATVNELREQRDTITSLLEQLPSRPYQDESVEAARRQGREALRSCIELCDTALNFIAAGERAERADKKRLRDQFEKVDDLENDWKNLLSKLRNQKGR